MKLHRFIGSYDLSKQEVKIINPENIKQIKDVLRLRKGDKVVLSDGHGKEAEVVLDFVSAKKITGAIEATPTNLQSKEKTCRKVNLYLAILKKENFEMAAQKAVEAGVSKIIPIITERTIKTGLNMQRLEKIILEASEQCGRSIVPILSPILNFQEALADGNNAKEKIIFHLGGKPYESNKETEEVSIFVGPEGGFTEKEVTSAKKASYLVTSLGPLVLRGETAAIIATYRAVKGI